MRRILAVVAVLLAVGTAGCTRHADDPTVATADPGGTKASASAAPTGQASALKFSQCMRAQGLTWFPDPQADGGLRVKIPDGDKDKFEKASEACKAYDPGSSSNGTISAADLDKLRQMAQCLREHRFPKYPDPDANGHTRITEGAVPNPDDPTFKKARQECQKYAPARSRGNS